MSGVTFGKKEREQAAADRAAAARTVLQWCDDIENTIYTDCHSLHTLRMRDIKAEKEGKL